MQKLIWKHTQSVEGHEVKRLSPLALASIIGAALLIVNDFLLALCGINPIGLFAIVYLPVTAQSAHGSILATIPATLAGAVTLWTFFYSTWEKQDALTRQLDHQHKQNSFLVAETSRQQMRTEFSKLCSEIGDVKGIGRSLRLLQLAHLVQQPSVAENGTSWEYPYIINAAEVLAQQFDSIEDEKELQELIRAVERLVDFSLDLDENKFYRVGEIFLSRSREILEKFLKDVTRCFCVTYIQDGEPAECTRLEDTLHNIFRTSSSLSFPAHALNVGFQIPRPKGGIQVLTAKDSTSEATYKEFLSRGSTVGKLQRCLQRLIRLTPKKGNDEQALRSHLEFELYGDSQVGGIVFDETFRAQHLARWSTRGMRWIGCRFASVDWSLGLMSSSYFFDCEFVNCRFNDTSLRESVFVNCSVRRCTFEGADLDHVFIVDTKLSDCIFSSASLNRSVFAGVSLTNLVFSESDMNSCVMQDVESSNVSFENCNLHKFGLHSWRSLSNDPLTLSSLKECNLTRRSFLRFTSTIDPVTRKQIETRRPMPDASMRMILE